MDFYTLTAIKFALGILTMLLQINILGKGQVLWSGVIVLCPSGWVMR